MQLRKSDSLMILSVQTASISRVVETLVFLSICKYMEVLDGSCDGSSGLNCTKGGMRETGKKSFSFKNIILTILQSKQNHTQKTRFNVSNLSTANWGGGLLPGNNP